MDDKMERKLQRKYFSGIGWTLLVYNLLLTACVTLVMMFQMVLISMDKLNGIAYTDQQVNQMLMNNGWGYLLSILIGALLLLMWQGKRFFTETLWVTGKPMKVGRFFALTAVFLGAQLVYSLMTQLLTMLLMPMGLSVGEVAGSANISTENFSMFLYVCIAAPITEEILFRGLVLRKLMPYGKGFAIIMSALAFGLFHGDLLQIPYAFMVGIIMGFVAVEYNILWAMVLHMINNLVLVDTIPRLISLLPDQVGTSIFGGIILFCGIAAVVILMLKREKISYYFGEHAAEWSHIFSFLTAPGMIVLMILMAVNALSGVVTATLQQMG